MSLNPSFDYVLNYKPEDFYAHNFEVPSDISCGTLTEACYENPNDERCFQQKLCENKKLSEQAMQVIVSHQEAETRQTDGSLVFDGAIEKCILFSVGILSMLAIGSWTFSTPTNVST
jgi:hypothetical protein